MEAFKGIPENVKEVFINPESGTSCQTKFSSDQDYLIYTGSGEPAPMAMTVFARSSNPSKIPLAWRSLENSPVYMVGGCNPSRTIKAEDPDLPFLRSAAKITPTDNAWIEGITVQNMSRYSRYADFVAAPNTALRFTSITGESKTAIADGNGAYRLESMPPGKVYSFRSKSPL